MRLGIEQIRANQLHRIKAAIRRNGGSIRWTVAVVEMRGPGSSGNGRLDSLTIKKFVAADSLTMSWDDEGNTLLSIAG